MVSERLAGDNLAAMWSRLSARDRLSALLDLWARVDAVHRTDVDRLPTLESTPIYALTPRTAQQQIARASATIEGCAAYQLTEIVAAGLDELDRVELALVHSDAGLSNAVWDGHAAVPVDFEFACIRPADLDLERLCREAAATGEDVGGVIGPNLISAAVRRPGGAARLRCYAVLFDLWAYGKWSAAAPTSIDTRRPGIRPTIS